MSVADTRRVHWAHSAGIGALGAVAGLVIVIGALLAWTATVGSEKAEHSSPHSQARFPEASVADPGSRVSPDSPEAATTTSTPFELAEFHYGPFNHLVVTVSRVPCSEYAGAEPAAITLIGDVTPTMAVRIVNCIANAEPTPKSYGMIFGITATSSSRWEVNSAYGTGAGACGPFIIVEEDSDVLRITDVGTWIR